MPASSAPVLATAIQTTPDGLVIITENGRFEILWKELISLI